METQSQIYCCKHVISGSKLIYASWASGPQIHFLNTEKLWPNIHLTLSALCLVSDELQIQHTKVLTPEPQHSSLDGEPGVALILGVYSAHFKGTDSFWTGDPKMHLAWERFHNPASGDGVCTCLREISIPGKDKSGKHWNYSQKWVKYNP